VSTLPQADRPIDDVQGHWLLARLGKRVLRPGGLELTTQLLDEVHLAGAEVVELAPGIGRTATLILAAEPAGYVGVDADPSAAALVAEVVGERGRIVTAEAMLTMQSPRSKKAIIDEAVRVLKPGGHYAIHELGLQPDDLDPAIADEIRKALARSIKVNARPLTAAEWTALLTEAGLEVEWVGRAPMALLQMRRNLADEGVRGVLRIAWNLVRNPGARRRVLSMRRTFTRYADQLTGIALVARKPA
jgi:SAM-dependent methyltransferase